MANDRYPYQKQWKTFRRNNLSLLAVVLAMAVLYVVISLDYEFIDNNKNPIGAAIFALWAALIFVSIKMMFWRCPKCREYYYAGTLRFDPTQGECRNCGLEKYAGADIKEKRTDRKKERIEKRTDRKKNG